MPPLSSHEPHNLLTTRMGVGGLSDIHIATVPLCHQRIPAYGWRHSVSSTCRPAGWWKGILMELRIWPNIANFLSLASFFARLSEPKWCVFPKSKLAASKKVTNSTSEPKNNQHLCPKTQRGPGENLTSLFITTK